MRCRDVGEPRSWSQRVRASCVAALALSAALMLMGLAGAAPASAREQTCPGGQTPEADLGISGMSCHCSVEPDEGSGEKRWRFRTEPEILGVRDDGPVDGVLRKGDRVVAIDGSLITTQAGGERWSSLRPGERTELRIRRGAGTETVDVLVGATCPEGRDADTAGLSEPPALPRVPQVAKILPQGWLGLGLSCNCTVEVGGEAPRWTFYQSPVIGGVKEGGPAEEAGVLVGDLLVAVDGQELTSQSGAELFSTIRPHQAVRLTIRRGDVERDVELVAGVRPEP